MFINGSELNEHSLQMTSKDASYHLSIHLTKRFQRTRFFRNQPIRNKNSLWQPCLLTNWNLISNVYKGPYNQISIPLAKQLQRRFFRNQPIRNKNCLWRPCLITDRDEMSNLYRGPAIDASYQVSVHLAKCFQRFLKIGQSETRIAYSGHVCSRIGTKWAIFIEDIPRMLPTRFRFIWQSGLRGEDFLEINQSETIIVCGGHIC